MTPCSDYDTWHQRLYDAAPDHEDASSPWYQLVREHIGNVHRWLREAGWTILRTDSTVHQFPFIPGHNPVRWESLESHRAVRKFISPFAYTYFVAAVKSERAK